MPFDQSTISNPIVSRSGADLLISWSSTAAVGTPFQIYIGSSLVWHGTQTQTVVPYPGGLGTLIVNIGTVGTAEVTTNFATSLPSVTYADKALLTWQGGMWESVNLAAFHVYSSPTPGTAVSYTTPLATVSAYTPGVTTDGWDENGWGSGGWGSSSGTYSWESASLAAGVWTFGIKPVDVYGNEGPTTEVSITITAPPLPPGRNAAGQRLTYTYNATTRVATLNWLPPGA